MKNAIKLATLAVLAATASISAHAAETADLAVKGTIRPSACNVAISTGEINLGTISALTLSDTAATTLPSHNFSVTVSCDAATQVALKSFDGRSGTIQDAARIALGAGGGYDAYGLGAVDGTNIGAFTVRRNANPSADGSTVALLISRNQGSTWAAQDANSFVRSWPTNSSVISWAATGQTTPGSYSTITEQFTLTPAIGPTSALPDLTNNGLATFEVRYL
jgi:type 1 fimbria pilin